MHANKFASASTRDMAEAGFKIKIAGWTSFERKNNRMAEQGFNASIVRDLAIHMPV